MQRVFHMTAQGILKDPLSGARYDSTQWPGRIVTVCPMSQGAEQGDFNYLAIVEDALPVSFAPTRSLSTSSMRSTPTIRVKRVGMACVQDRVPLTVHRTSRLWFQCSRVRMHH